MQQWLNNDVVVVKQFVYIASVILLRWTGETAKGAYPVQAVQMMHRISREAEAAIFHRQLFDSLRHSMEGYSDIHETTALAAVAASFTANAAVIICLTHTGR